MKNFNLKGRILEGYRRNALTIQLGLSQLKRTAIRRKFAAASMLSKLIVVTMLLGLMPTQAANSRIKTASKADSVQAKIKLVLNADSRTLSASAKNLEITVVESKREEAERIAQEEAAKNARQTVVVARSVPVPAIADVPFEQKRSLAQRAAATYGIDWKILEAVWQVESGKRYYTSTTSYAGAQGPMQFLPATWRAYQVDGNGDGYADIHNAEDAVYAAANYLAANGGATNIDRALLAYNHAQWYVDKVKNLADTI